MTIIQVRGTSGSGKSTAVRALMAAWGTWQPVHVPKRKKPLYYQCGWDPPGWTVVLGHYESPCGGCDTIGSARAVYDLIQEVKAKHPGVNILCEGLLLSEDSLWTREMAKTDKVTAIFLTTKTDECLTRIKGRREAAGNAKELNPFNTVNRVAVIEKSRVKLVEAGIDCRRCPSASAAKLVLRLLRGE